MKISVYKIERVVFAIMLFFLYIYNFQTDGAGNTITNILIVAFIGFEAMFFFRRKGRAVVSYEVECMLLFVLICAISTMYSTAQGDSINKVKTLFVMLVFFASLISFIGRGNNLNLMLKTISVCSVVAAAYCIINSSWLSGIRVDNIIGDTNQVSAYLAYSMTILLLCGKKKMLSRPLLYLGVVLILFANIIGGSRSGLIATLLGLLGFLFLNVKKNKYRILKIAGLVVLSTIGFLMLARLIMTNPILYKIIGRRYVSFFEIMSGKTSSIGETSTDERNLLRQLAWNKFISNPGTILGGNGISYFNSYYESIGGGYYFCHNNYLELLSGVGIFGTICFYTPYVKTGARAVRNFIKKRTSEGTAAIIVLIQILIMHWFVVFYYQKLEFVIIAAIIGIAKRANWAICEETTYEQRDFN